MRLVLLLIFSLFFLAPVTSEAQGIFVRVGGGYALGASGDDTGTDMIVNGSNVTQTAIFASLGQGGIFGLEVGYEVDEHIGVQLGAEYLAGAFATTSLSEDGNNLGSTSSKGSQFRLLPAITISGGLGDIDPYVRFGLSLPLSSTTVNQVSISDSTSSFDYEEEIVGAFNLGFTGALGLSISAGSRLRIFGEFGGISQRVHGVSGQVTRRDVDGASTLADLSAFESQWNYLDVLDPNSNSVVTNSMVDTDLPEDRIQISQNFSSFFIKVGVALSFGNASAD